MKYLLDWIAWSFLALVIFLAFIGVFRWLVAIAGTLTASEWVAIILFSNAAGVFAAVAMWARKDKQ